MKICTFAAIYIGSYEVSLKVFEISPKIGIREIDFIRSRMELGRDAYYKRSVGYELVEALCNTLLDFKKTINAYKADVYEVYATAVLSNSANMLFILDQIRIRTGLNVKVLSNSDHRFLSYKSIAVREEFEKMIQKGAAFVDAGGSGMQVTIFSKGKMLTTQNLGLGTMKLRERLEKKSKNLKQYEEQIEELVNKNLEVFKSIHMENIKIKYLIITGDYIPELVRKIEKKQEETSVDSRKLLSYLKNVSNRSVEEIEEELSLPDESSAFLIPYMMILKCMANGIGADRIWAPGVDISDGIACDYAQRKRLIKITHDFDEDILSSARTLAQRYLSYEPHLEALEQMSLLIFDTMKKVHGLGARERLLLQVATILHDCGKFISIANAANCSRKIIMASEIIGLTHKEREIVANAVLYKSIKLPTYDDLADEMDQESYLIVAKLSAILRVANAMDRSHKQKFKNIKAAIKGKELVITIETEGDAFLEKALFDTRTEYFEYIFSIKPVIKEKRVYL